MAEVIFSATFVMAPLIEVTSKKKKKKKKSTNWTSK